MKDSWQVTAVRTIDLGYEQLLFLEGGRGSHVQVQFRGAWIHDAAAGRKHGPRRADSAVPGAVRQKTIEPPRVALRAPAWGRWQRRLGEALRDGFVAAAGRLAPPATR